MALIHRGPDAQTEYLDGPVGFGHARLSIIDLEGGWQPLFNEDRTVSVVCTNGEIYNYRQEQRELLLHRGHQFRTGSVIVKFSHTCGKNLVREMTSQLRGMFAFVLYDNRQGIVFGAARPISRAEAAFTTTLTRTVFRLPPKIKGLLALPEHLSGLWIHWRSISFCSINSCLNHELCLNRSRSCPCRMLF